MKLLKSIFVLSLIVTLSACSKDAVTKTDNDRGSVDINPAIQNIDVKKPEPIVVPSTKPLEDGIEASIVVPVISTKEIALKDFLRTLESTYLNLKIKSINPALLGEDTTFTLMSQGYVVSTQKVNLTKDQNTLELDFRAPRFGTEGQETGVENVAYELLISNSKRDTHLPFTFKIYAATNSSLIVPRDTSCSIYEKPEPASGCLQNRTRTTQELVFNNNITVGSESDITFSGGITLSVGVVQAQFGAQKTQIGSQSSSQGSEMHFTNCIECSSMIFRQKVETVRMGDVYRVIADGSLQWVGDVKYSSTALSYEFTSTGSESRNYSCSFDSQLPVGPSPGCDDIAKP